MIKAFPFCKVQKISERWEFEPIFAMEHLTRAAGADFLRLLLRYIIFSALIKGIRSRASMERTIRHSFQKMKRLKSTVFPVLI